MNLSLADVGKFIDDMQAKTSCDPGFIYVKSTEYHHLMHICKLQAQGKSYVPSKRKKHKSPARMPKDIKEEAKKYQAYRRKKCERFPDGTYLIKIKFLNVEGNVLDESAFS